MPTILKRLLTGTAVVILLYFGFLIGSYVEQPYRPSANKTTVEGTEIDPEKRHLGSWSDVAIAFFTGILTIVAIIQGVQLRASNKTAKTAVEYSEKNFAAYVSVERGRILFDTAVIERGRYSQKRDTILFTFKNVGRSAAVIDTISFRIRSSPRMELSPVASYIGMRGSESLPVIEGGEFTEKYYIPNYCFYDDDVEEPYGGELSDEWIVQCSIIYSTMGMRMHYWCAWGWAEFGEYKITDTGFEGEELAPNGWPGKERIAEDDKIYASIKEYAAKRGHPIQEPMNYYDALDAAEAQAADWDVHFDTEPEGGNGSA